MALCSKVAEELRVEGTHTLSSPSISALAQRDSDTHIQDMHKNVQCSAVYTTENLETLQKYLTTENSVKRT